MEFNLIQQEERVGVIAEEFAMYHQGRELEDAS